MFIQTVNVNPPQFAYISFDVVPAPKGSATHIEAFVKTLAQALGKIKLITVSPTAERLDRAEYENGIDHTALPALGKTLIHRVLHFRKQLKYELQRHPFQVIHIRSIYEGFPIAVDKSKYCDRLIFEVNGMPSVELKYRYPDVAGDRELMQKLLTQEQVCLEAADLIVTPATVTRNYLISRRISPEKIRVIPNGVNTEIFTYFPKSSLSTQIIYFGTLSAWQGVNLAVRAIALLNPAIPTQLKVIGTGSKRQVQALKDLARKLGVSQNVIYLEPLPQPSLVAEIHASDAIVAPLTLNDRNLVQGCCPLKVLEGMATGTPVIASDLPVVRELGRDREHFFLVKPNSVQAIADAILYLRNHPRLSAKIATTARQQIETHYTWEQAGTALVSAYESLGIKRAIAV